MFGWAFIIATGYCKAHGLIPDPEKLLDFKQWGTLAIISGGKGGGITITNERACILVANIHFLVVSLCAAFCPLPFQDTLLLEPGEPDEEPAGLVPAFDTGLTPAAELWNGRLAMLGLIIFEGVLDDLPDPVPERRGQRAGWLIAGAGGRRGRGGRGRGRGRGRGGAGRLGPWWWGLV